MTELAKLLKELLVFDQQNNTLIFANNKLTYQKCMQKKYIYMRVYVSITVYSKIIIEQHITHPNNDIKCFKF